LKVTRGSETNDRKSAAVAKPWRLPWLHRKRVVMKFAKRVAGLKGDQGHLAISQASEAAFGFEAAQHHMKSW
jgi:hypothetical protein